MRLKYISLFLFAFYVFVPIDLNCKIRAGAKPRVTTKSKSSVKAKNSTVVNNSSNFNVGQLQIQVNQNAALEGLPVNFELGGYSTNNGSQTSFTGSYVPSTGTAVVSNSACQSLPGTVNFPLAVSGNASLEGVGNMPNGLSLADASTNLTLNASNAVNSNINLNGGTSTLQSDLNFGSDSQFQGTGSIEGNGNSVILGGKDLIMTSTLNWINADVVANSRLTLWGTWNFYGDVHVLGRGNVLDLSNGGDLIIKSNARVYIANLTIRGLGSGTIQFQDDTGQLVLASCTIELDNDYNFNKGGIYIDAPTTVITANNILSFDTNASMTVDGCALWYDTLTFDDDSNIRPTPAQDPNEKFIAYFNNGIIKQVGSGGGGGGGDKHYTADTLLAEFTVYSPNARGFFDASLSFDGNDNVAYFASSAVPVSFVAAGTRTTFSNIRLQNYAPSLMDLDTGASIIFDDGTVIDLGISDELNMTWTFRGNCVLRGDGNTLNLGQYGAIFVQGAGSSLTLENINLTGVSGNKIRCSDNTTVISLKNANWLLESDYSFTKGRFDVLNKFEIRGGAVFNYQTAGQSQILAGATMFVDMDTVFNYAPSINNRDLIFMEDPSAILYLNGATLASSTTGLRLTSGTVIADKVNYIDNPGAISVSQGVEFGDGTLAGDLNVNIVPGAKIEVLSGCFNVN